MDLVGSLSPLQRMASITNSLVSQPSLPGQPNSANRPNRACLPPITQQQFDRFSHLNTDEVVRRVSLFFLYFSRYIVHTRIKWFYRIWQFFFLLLGQRHPVSILYQPTLVWRIGSRVVTR